MPARWGTMRLDAPRLTVAGLAGDSGKTLLSLGVARALAERGLAVHPFKKGPDYIDAAWLTLAAGRPCSNLDTFLMAPAAIGTVLERAAGADLILVEGNRGLYDGVDASGTHSTAELSKLLGAPVILTVDVTKSTRTVAAMVLGCCHLDPEVPIAGVVLGRVATSRQERVIREAVEEATGLPVLGAVPRVRDAEPLPGRHLGLVTAAEHPAAEAAVERAAELVRAHVDLDRLLELAASARAVDLSTGPTRAAGFEGTVGYLQHPAFSFYYPENLASLEAAGARVVPVTLEQPARLAELDALYLGGGFPELHAPALTAAQEFAAALNHLVRQGLPVYAECGGLMYLARELWVGGVCHPMAGVLDLVVEQTDRPCGHGYEIVEVDRPNPFFATGTRLRGHEFHYSRVVGGADAGGCVGRTARGTGLGGRDGIVRGRVWASYLHLHAAGEPAWADGLLDLAAAFRRERGERAAWA